jgi:hypothetical protein
MWQLTMFGSHMNDFCWAKLSPRPEACSIIKCELRFVRCDSDQRTDFWSQASVATVYMVSCVTLSVSVCVSESDQGHYLLVFYLIVSA